MHHAPDVLKSSGYKLTPQRLLIWHILAGGKHYSANEIHQKVKKEFPGVDLATVYRTLELLVRLGLIQESSFAFGPARFEATEEMGHDHLSCRKCGKVEHFQGEKIQKAIDAVCKDNNFDAQSTEINLSSICNECLAKEGK